MKLQVKHIAKTFTQANETITLFSDLNMTLNQGEACVLMGASGSGKTTLLRMINGLQKPDSGKILCDDFSIYEHEEKDIRNFRSSEIGFADQYAVMLPQLTALENVLLPTIGHKGNWTEQANALLSELGLSSRIDFFPHQLSGGEKQRVAWARALIRSPKLLLLDEPTSALDSQRSHALLSMLQTINRDKNISIIIATHQVSTLDYFPRVMKLETEEVA
ncbi:MAG: ABC transporter ATP-binding protein [Phycisphaeraceae bacterium JB051]